ncbi:unnamed protein product, partial [Rotaria socialis]
SAGANFLGDTELVENLESTKRTATEIEEKVGEAKRLSSRRFNVILNSFCCLVKSDFNRSRSGRS